MITLTLTPKNAATLQNFLKTGINHPLSDMQNMTFNDVIFDDGEKVKDVTFNEFQTLVFTKQSKNQTTLTNVTKP